MPAPIDQRHAARETRVEVDGHAYTIRRPTALHRTKLAGKGAVEVVRECVVGWDLRFIDLIPGGDPTPAPFDTALWSDWLDDTPAIWAPLLQAITDAIDNHDARVKEASGK